MKRKSLWLALVAVVLVAAMGIAPAWAYFTDTSTAKGGIPIKVTTETEIYEKVADGVKHVTITNSKDSSTAVFVRARAYISGMFESYEISGSGWHAGEADQFGTWYYYEEAVEPGGETSELDIAIKFPKIKTEDPNSSVVIDDNFNVVVVYEAVPAQYDEKGEPAPDWSKPLDSETEQSGGM